MQTYSAASRRAVKGYGGDGEDDCKAIKAEKSQILDHLWMLIRRGGQSACSTVITTFPTFCPVSTYRYASTISASG